MTIAYDSPTFIKQFLEAEGLAMSKRFGQNFLVDRNAREKLYAALALPPLREPGTNGLNPPSVWEIGPGIGALTSLLLERGNRVCAFEIDYGFARILNRLFGDTPRFSIVEGDFLKTWRAAALSPAEAASDATTFPPAARSDDPRATGTLPDLVFGNLPYNAALGIIADLLENLPSPPRMVFTVQKEAARRIVALPGSKDYSAFSVLCASVCEVKMLYDIGASAFWPQPRVTSSVVTLRPRPDPIAAGDRKGFSRFVRSAFSSRRKTLRNNLCARDKGAGPRLDSTLERLGIDPGIRAEALDPPRLFEVYAAIGP
jgi:16S rRNA (adenine1518-N6/adenine1519-N6)-dimethyltransferase